MARKFKTDLTQADASVPQRKFTDREEPQQYFTEALATVNERDYSILTFYGVGGIGKSRLQQHLKEAHLDKDENSLYYISHLTKDV